MTKPQNVGVGDLGVMQINCQQHPQGLRANQKSTKKYLCLFLNLRICSSGEPEQISHGFSKVTQGSSPLLASQQAGQ